MARHGHRVARASVDPWRIKIVAPRILQTVVPAGRPIPFLVGRQSLPDPFRVGIGVLQRDADDGVQALARRIVGPVPPCRRLALRRDDEALILEVRHLELVDPELRQADDFAFPVAAGVVADVRGPRGNADHLLEDAHLLRGPSARLQHGVARVDAEREIEHLRRGVELPALHESFGDDCDRAGVAASTQKLIHRAKRALHIAEAEVLLSALPGHLTLALRRRFGRRRQFDAFHNRRRVFESFLDRRR